MRFEPQKVYRGNRLKEPMTELSDLAD